MPETPKARLSRLLKERKTRRANRKSLIQRAMELERRITKLTQAIKRTRDSLKGVPGNVDGWHPQATRVPYAALTFAPGYPKRGVLHTTEGHGLPGYAGTNPHFTISLTTGKLWQHASVFNATKALVHSESTETNRAGAIQIEITDAFAKDSPNWSNAEYARVAKLMRWVEKNVGVPRRCSVKFAVPARRMTNAEWSVYSGWCGHEHVPQNSHWDPGALNIDKLL